MEKNKDSDNLLSIYLNEIGKIPLLNKKEEADLIGKAQAGDEEAKKKIIRANLKFVVAIAKKYFNHGIPLSDLINEGNIGLIKAIDKFDLSKGHQFITYAVFWIRQGIIRSLQNNSRMIRLPANKIKEIYDIKKVQKKLRLKLDRDPNTDEIAEELEIKSREVDYLLAISREIISIESAANNSDTSISDYIHDNKLMGTEEKVEQDVLIDEINAMLNDLPDKQKDIIKARFGLDGRPPLSLEKIANQYNVSRERIRQIEKKALAKLRNSKRSYKLRPFINGLD